MRSGTRRREPSQFIKDEVILSPLLALRSGPVLTFTTGGQIGRGLLKAFEL